MMCRRDASWRASRACAGACGARGYCGGWDKVGGHTAKTIERWPSSVPITFIAFETVLDVHCGGALVGGAPASSPLRQAFMDFCGGVGGSGGLPKWCDESGRSSWDPMAVLLAVRGPQRFYSLEPGYNRVDAVSGQKCARSLTPACFEREEALCLSVEECPPSICLSLCFCVSVSALS